MEAVIDPLGTHRVPVLDERGDIQLTIKLRIPEPALSAKAPHRLATIS